MIGLAAGAASAVAKKVGVHISFKSPSDKRARNVMGAVVAAANAGNLAAVAVLDSRRTGAGIAKERAEWVKGFAQVSADVMARYTPQRAALIAAIPTSAKASPEAAAAYATGGAAQPADPIAELVAPIGAALDQSDAALREGIAQTIERAGVGGGAAAAKAVRGSEGPLDKLIEYAKDPTGMIVLAIAGVSVLIVGAVVIARVTR